MDFCKAADARFVRLSTKKMKGKMKAVLTVYHFMYPQHFYYLMGKGMGVRWTPSWFILSPVLRKNWGMLILLFCLAGCSDKVILSYEYTDVTPMGIKYRVDAGAASLDADRLDYYFASVMNCVGRSYDPNNLLVISTVRNIDPELRERDVVVINAINARALTYAMLTYEFVYVITGNESLRCSEVPFGYARY